MTKKRKIDDLDSKQFIIDDEFFLITQTKIMRLSLVEALEFLEVRGYKMKKTTYYKKLKEIENDVHKRMMELAKTGLLETHMKIVDTIHTCERLIWNSYYKLTDKPYEQTLVLEKILRLQPYITGAYVKTKAIMETQAAMRSKFFPDDGEHQNPETFGT